MRQRTGIVAHRHHNMLQKRWSLPSVRIQYLVSPIALDVCGWEEPIADLPWRETDAAMLDCQQDGKLVKWFYEDDAGFA